MDRLHGLFDFGGLHRKRNAELRGALGDRDDINSSPSQRSESTAGDARRPFHILSDSHDNSHMAHHLDGPHMLVEHLQFEGRFELRLDPRQVRLVHGEAENVVGRRLRDDQREDFLRGERAENSWARQGLAYAAMFLMMTSNHPQLLYQA